MASPSVNKRRTSWSKSQSALERFLARIHKTESCWQWIGPFGNHGYGAMEFHRDKDTSHRWSYRLFKGAIPDGAVVRHSCDNKKCANPDHLLIGSHADNVEDKVRRGRQPYGKDHGRTKLTDEQVKFLVNHPEIGAIEMGRRLAVSHSLVSMIRSGKRRQHLLQKRTA